MKTSTGLQNSGTTTGEETRVEGPIPEYDRYGDYTDYDYFQYTDCGIEATRRRNLHDGGYKCNGGWS